MGSFITGFQAGETQDDVWGFPVGLVSDDEGSLYLSSDNRNQLIIKITHSPIGGSWQHNLPTTMTLGATLDFQATVEVERLDPNGGLPRLTADLSAFGGPTALPLSALDDQTYRVEARLITEGLPKGLYPIKVRIEQEIGGVLHNFDLLKNITLLPPDLSVFDETLAANWQLNGTRGAQVQDLPDGPIYHGAHSTAIAAEPVNFYTSWHLEFRPDAPVERLGYAGVRFAFYPGEIELPKFPTFILYIDGLGVDLFRDPEKYQIDLMRREWQVLEIPFEAFNQPNFYGPGLRDQVDFIDVLRLEGNITGTFYLDDLRLVTQIPSAPPTPTAVLEESGAGEPTDFDLAQNYPNPFNSSTAIHFALPQAAETELSIYNLAGQRVAQLLRGWHEAGPYTVRWDGSTDAESELATGVYIYRLRTGQLVLSRKLLLLR